MNQMRISFLGKIVLLCAASACLFPIFPAEAASGGGETIDPTIDLTITMTSSGFVPATSSMKVKQDGGSLRVNFKNTDSKTHEIQVSDGSSFELCITGTAQVNSRSATAMCGGYIKNFAVGYYTVTSTTTPGVIGYLTVLPYNAPTATPTPTPTPFKSATATPVPTKKLTAATPTPTKTTNTPTASIAPTTIDYITTVTATPTPIPSYSETFIKVVDKNGKPIGGAKVSLKSNNQVAFTDNEGIARFKNIDSGSQTAVVTYNSTTLEQHVDVVAGSSRILSVQANSISVEDSRTPLYVVLGALTLFLAGSFGAFAILLRMLKSTKTNNQ